MSLIVLCLLTFFKFILFQDCVCLKNVNLEAVPRTVIRGSTVTLLCRYDLEGQNLYMVTWYRGNHQVYRYVPSDRPPAKVFPRPGFNVDMGSSNRSQLKLLDTSDEVGGLWKCEVTSESPSFSTSSSSLLLYVLDVSDGEPVLTVRDADRTYRAGDWLRANCTPQSARPSPLAMFYLNQAPLDMRDNKVKVTSTRDPVTWDTKWITLEMEVSEFDVRRGFIVLECLTSVAGIQGKTAFKHLAAQPQSPLNSPQTVRLMASAAPCLGLVSLARLISLLAVHTVSSSVSLPLLLGMTL